MQLRFSLPVPKLGTSIFKQSTSAILTGVTIAGAFSTIIFNSTSAKGKVSDAFKTFADVLASTPLYDGAKAIGNTFKDWGTTLVAKKDEFKKWVEDYLNASGLKSGAVELYNKLYAWAEIVYDWFKNKFLIFISRIPEMVKNWKQLRLSLFKWGTFLGGGGGAALWAMFGSFDDIGKLADLMGNEQFMEAAEKFAELVQENSEEFGKMSEEEMKEIFQKMMDDPEESKKIAEELLEEQKQENKDKKEEEKKEIEKDKLYESFAQPKGSPKDEGEVFGYLMGDALKALLKSSSFDSPLDKRVKEAKDAMQEYFKQIESESKKGTKAGKANKAFLDALDNNKDKLIEEFGTVVAKAFDSAEKLDFPSLSKSFEKVMKDKYTVEMEGDSEEQGVSLDNIVKDPKPKKK